MNLRKNFSKLPSLILALLLLSSTIMGVTTSSSEAAPSQVQEPDTVKSECHNLDLVVLVDQSTSMRSSDPRILRLEVAKLIIQQLGDHAILLCPDQTIRHRLAVLGFGDRSRYLGPENNYQEDVSEYLTPQTIPPVADWEAWQKERESLKETIDQFYNHDLSYTDHTSALLAAKDILRAWVNEPISAADSNRYQGIILITDGESCTGSAGCSANSDNYVFDRQVYMDSLVALASPNGTEFPFVEGGSNNIYISMIALTDNSQTFNYRTNPTFRNGWTQIVGDRGQIFDTQENNLDLTEGVFTILRPLIGSNLTDWECERPIVVTPYLDSSLIINLTRQGADPGVTPEDVKVFLDISGAGHILTLREGQQLLEDGTTIDFEDGVEFTRDGLTDYYVFTNPLPGQYEIRVEGADRCEDINIQVGKGSVVTEVNQPDETIPLPQVPDVPFYHPDAPPLFQLSVYDEDVLLREFEGFPLEISIEITNPRQNVQRFTLTPSAAKGPGVYESTEPIQTGVSGTHIWRVVGCTNAPVENLPADIPLCPSAPTKVQVFEKTGTFEVSPVTFFNLRISTPAVGAAPLAMNHVVGERQVANEIPVTVRLVDDAGNPLDINDVFNQTEDLVEARLYKEGNATPVETIFLNLPAPGVNEFTGRFTNNANGLLFGEGYYTVEVAPRWEAEDYNYRQYAPVPDQESATVSLEQFEIYPVTVRILPPNPEEAILHRHTIWSCFTHLSACFGEEIRPLEFGLEIVYVKSGEIVDLAQVLQNVDSDYTVLLAAPDNQQETVPLQPLQTANAQQLRAIGAGQQLAAPGEYTIQAALMVIPLQENYTWANAEQTLTFTREDTWETNPLLAKGAVILTGIVVAILFIIALYLLTGGPAGQLAIVSVGPRGNLVLEAGPWKLRPTPRTNRFQSKWLKEHDIKFVRVVKTQPSDQEARRAVQVEAINVSGMPEYQGSLDTGMQDYFSGEMMIYYKHPAVDL